jgi:Holliday junction resolvase RusA-like endonuclease
MLKFKVDYKPTPLKRPRLTRIGGKPVIYDASKKEKRDWLNLARIFSPDKPFDGPLRINLEFYFPRPKNHYRTGKYSEIMKPTAPHIHTNMPDIDNLSKFILDAMNEVFYEDDRQVVELNSHKEYLNDKKNTTGYTIVNIMPYEKKLSFFNQLIVDEDGNQVESFVLTKEYMENNKTKHAFNKIFPNNIPDSSSESM